MPNLHKIVVIITAENIEKKRGKRNGADIPKGTWFIFIPTPFTVYNKNTLAYSGLRGLYCLLDIVPLIHQVCLVLILHALLSGHRA